MAYKIIESKQALLKAASELELEGLAPKINKGFSDLEALFNTDQKRIYNETFQQLKTDLFSQLEMNRQLSKEALEQSTEAIVQSPPLQFPALNQLQDFIAMMPPDKTEASRKAAKIISQAVERRFNPVVKKQSELKTAYETLANNKEPRDALTNFLKKMSEGVIQESVNTNYLADNTWLSYMDKVQTLEEMKSLAIQFENNKRPIEEKLAPFQDFLMRRWERIRNTHLAYAAAPKNILNQECANLANLIADFSLDLGHFSLLMPSISMLKSDSTYTHLDDPELKLEHFIVSDDGKRFIEIQSCLGGAEEDGILKNTALMNDETTMRELTSNEKSRLRDHSQFVNEYIEKINLFRDFTSNPKTGSVGVHLQRLCEQLEKGGAKKSEQSNLSNKDVRKATESNAGEAANIGILEFADYLKFLPENKRNEIFALKANGATEDFGKIWRRLSTPTAIDLRNTNFCVEMLSGQIRSILHDNPQLYNSGTITKEDVLAPLTAAKTAFLEKINSGSYEVKPTKANSSEISPAILKDFIAHTSARSKLQLEEKFLSLGKYSDAASFKQINQKKLDFLRLQLAVSDSLDIGLRIREFNQMLNNNIFIPLENFFGEAFWDIANKFFPYRFTDESFSNIGWWNADKFKRFDLNYTKPSITSVAAAVVYTAISFVPYLIAQAGDICINLIEGKPWNAKNYYYQPRDWRNLGDMHAFGYSLMFLASLVAVPMAYATALACRAVAGLAYLAVQPLKLVTYPVVAVAAALTEGTKWLANKVSNLFVKKPETKIEPAAVVVAAINKAQAEPEKFKPKNHTIAKLKKSLSSDYQATKVVMTADVDKPKAKAATKSKKPHFWHRAKSSPQIHPAVEPVEADNKIKIQK